MSTKSWFLVTYPWEQVASHNLEQSINGLSEFALPRSKTKREMVSASAVFEDEHSFCSTLLIGL